MIRRFFTYLVAFGLYLLVAVYLTWPLAGSLSTSLAGFRYGDGYEMAHHIWWFKHAIQTGQPLFYQTMMGYPDGIEGITLWAHPLQFFPAWALALVLPLPLAANLVILVTLALNGLAMFALARYLTRYVPHDFTPETLPALLAGLAYMAFPTMQGHLGAGHAGLMAQWPVPLFVLALLKLRDTGARRYILLSALLFVVSTFGHTLQAIYVLLPITAVYLLRLLIRRDGRALGQALVAIVLGAVLLGLFLIPVVGATLRSAAYTDAGGSIRYSADLLAAVTPSFLHPVFGQWAYTHRVLGVNLDEGAAYVGVVALLLGVVALVAVRAARWWVGVALVAYLFSLGPLLKLFDQPVQLNVGGYETFVTLPGLIFDKVPLLNLGRTPGRFNFALALAVAALVALGAAYLLARIRPAVIRALLTVLLGGVVLFEYQTFAPFPTIPAAVPDAITALSERDDIRAVFDVPWDHLVAAKEGLYFQTKHEQALIAGQVTRSTPVDPAKLEVLEGSLDPALLNEAGADIVIVHRDFTDNDILLTRARAQLGEPIYEDDHVAVFETPETDAEPQFTDWAPMLSLVPDRAQGYFYAPEAGWVTLGAQLRGERGVSLTLDGEAIHHWRGDALDHFSLPLPIVAPGYHTFEFVADEACPLAFGPALVCRSLAVDNLILDAYAPGSTGQTADYSNGVTLAASRVESLDEGQLPVWLWWQFDEARTDTDIRFVHLIDESGELVAQVDGTLGEHAAGGGWLDMVVLELPDDAPTGTYRVLAGWYTYPDFTRFPVLSDVPGAAEGYVEIGDVAIGN